MHPSYTGAHETVTLDGCKLVPPGFVGNRLRSVQRDGQCVQLYNNIHCNITSVYDSIELRDNTPFHDDLSRWGFRNAKAISHCTHKCTEGGSVQKNMNLSILSKDHVILYDHTGFEGLRSSIKYGTGNER